MTEHEVKILENLTKQLELSNKIALKQMQEQENRSTNEALLDNAEINLMREKERFFKNTADLINVLSTIIVITAIIVGIVIISGLGACASNF